LHFAVYVFFDHFAVVAVVVTAFEEKTQARKAPPPFTTSTLQQAAANRLKIGVETTMKLAQALFEAGLITYHRTDNPNLSQEGVQMVWDYLRAKGQAQYIPIPEKANTWKAKDGAQEAHEAIRPTDFHTYDPQTGNAQQDALYKLIWRRALACQMRDAQFQVRTAQLQTLSPVAALQGLPPGNDAPAPTALFKSSGSLRIYDGWMRVADDDYTNEDEAEAANPLPKLVVGAQYVAQDGQILDLETKPPSRYSEPALIRALEREGIGRPSTYASIIGTIQQRGYVEVAKRQFVPTELGTALIQALRGRFDFLEIAYTKNMEDHLDAIAQGKAGYRAVVVHYDQALDAQLAVFAADTSIQPLAGAEETFPCPNCGDGHLREISLHWPNGADSTFQNALEAALQQQHITLNDAAAVRLQIDPTDQDRIRTAIGGITPKVLTDTLRSMERDGLITRDQAPGVPPRVDYALTPLGSTLAEPMNALRTWAEGHAEEILDNRVRYDGVALDSAR